MNVLFTKQQAHDEIECIFRELLPQNGMAQRPEQIRLCHSMLDAMLDGSIALCDAGTGIGKTFAYLVAGIMLEKYEDAQHHNCVFVGYDETGKAVFANQRGTYDQGGSSFKGDVPGSDKSIGFRLPYDPDSNTVFVFEAPIDLMSYCTLHRDLRGNAVALCCLHDAALATYLREHPRLRHIELCLDNDRWGQAAAKQMQETCSAKGFTVSRQLPPQGKDWNEYLQKRTRDSERGR